MSGKIILNLAMSIDGYISDEDGGYDWIVGDGNRELDTDKKWDYEKFLEGIDIVVMGKRCYEQNFHNDFKNKKVYIATSEKIEDYENIHFVNEGIVKVIEEKKLEGKNIFLFGGGVLLDSFFKANIIDEYIIGVIPTILGKGRKLFLENNPKINLRLEEYIADEGIMVLRYSNR